MSKLIVRIKGGIGNQLFTYAYARYLSLKNEYELVLDSTTGFSYDFKYKRKFQLDNFSIQARKATRSETFQPLPRLIRFVLRHVQFLRNLFGIEFLEEEEINYNDFFFNLKLKSKVLYLEGYFQSENYFKEIEHVLRVDLVINEPEDSLNRAFVKFIENSNSVAVHIRFFDGIVNNQSTGAVCHSNVSVDYYNRAFEYIKSKVQKPHFFIFSDRLDLVNEAFNLSLADCTIVSHNVGDDLAIADLWLMSNCNHFITANSTFSWWGAWLARNTNKIVITPKFRSTDESSWGFNGLIPDNWIEM